MKYYVNSSALYSAFPVPAAVVDKHIKMAGAVQLKVLLYMLRNSSADISPEAVSAALSIPSDDVCDSMRFWAQLGILTAEGESEPSKPQPLPEKTRVVKRAAVKPSREEIAKRGVESEEVAFLLREAEQRFGRTLRQSEASTLVWLFDDEGLGVAVILMLIEFAISEGKLNIGFIERTAVSWIEAGVEDIPSAERQIKSVYAARGSWNEVRRAFGIEQRLPSKKESEYSILWVETRRQSSLLREAYNQCVDNIGKLSFPYVAKILDKWFQDGVRTPEDIEKKSKKAPAKNDDFATYDRSLVDDMINAIDKN